MHEMKKLGVDVTFTQMTAKKGINKYGVIKVATMYKECTKLEYMRKMEELDPTSLIGLQKKGEFMAINLIKEKRIRKLKGRMCAYGRPKRFYITKEGASSPIIYLVYFFTSLIIDEHEERIVSFFMSLEHTSTLTYQKINLSC